MITGSRAGTATRPPRPSMTRAMPTGPAPRCRSSEGTGSFAHDLLNARRGAAANAAPRRNDTQFPRGHFLATPLRFAGLLLLSSALTVPAIAQGASTDAAPDSAGSSAPDYVAPVRLSSAGAAATGGTGIGAAITRDDTSAPHISVPGGDSV